jgi:CheY-like chemotaxis protein
VLLDVALPDASGFELCRRLRQGEPGRDWNRDIPVIIVSERGEPIDRLRGFARGCDDYVVKGGAPARRLGLPQPRQNVELVPPTCGTAQRLPGAHGVPEQPVRLAPRFESASINV